MTENDRSKRIMIRNTKIHNETPEPLHSFIIRLYMDRLELFVDGEPYNSESNIFYVGKEKVSEVFREYRFTGFRGNLSYIPYADPTNPNFFHTIAWMEVCCRYGARKGNRKYWNTLDSRVLDLLCPVAWELTRHFLDITENNEKVCRMCKHPIPQAEFSGVCTNKECFSHKFNEKCIPTQIKKFAVA